MNSSNASHFRHFYGETAKAPLHAWLTLSFALSVNALDVCLCISTRVIFFVDSWAGLGDKAY